MAARRALRGKNMMLWADNLPVALATAASLDLAGDSEETTSKDSGSWKDFIVTTLGWTMSNDSLVSVIADDGNSVDLAYKELFAKFIKMDPIVVTFAELATRTNAANSRPDAGWIAPTTTGFKGKAYITSLSISAPVDGKATMSISLQGTGELAEQVTPPSN